jgi:hypothetical protein
MRHTIQKRRRQGLDGGNPITEASGRAALSDGLLLHPHTIVSMLINDLADMMSAAIRATGRAGDSADIGQRLGIAAEAGADIVNTTRG